MKKNLQFVTFFLMFFFMLGNFAMAQELQLTKPANSGHAAPETGLKEDGGEWIKYYEYVNDNALGLGGDVQVQWNAAIRWMPVDLTAFEGYSVTRIRIFMNDEPGDATAKIWQGTMEAPVEMVSQSMATAEENWVEVELFDPYLIDITQELWIGWEIGDLGAGNFPAAFDDTNAHTPKSDLLQFGDNPWQNAATYNFDVAWNIEAYVVPGGPVPDDYMVTFRVNMAPLVADGFDPAVHNVFLTGDFAGWAQPGAEGSVELTLDAFTVTNLAGDKPNPHADYEDVFFSATVEVPAGDIQYKYFSNAIGPGWEGGEWHGDPNRIITVAGDMVVNDVWGIIDLNEHHTVSFTVYNEGYHPVGNAMISIYLQAKAPDVQLNTAGFLLENNNSKFSHKSLFYKVLESGEMIISPYNQGADIVLNSGAFQETSRYPTIKKTDPIILYTNENGFTSFEAQAGYYLYVIEKEGYHNYSNDFSVTNSDVNLYVILETDYGDYFAGGSGTEEDPFLIETAEHLNNIRYYLGWENSDKYFQQIADIDLGVAPWNQGTGWEPIGNQGNRFMGTYDGNDYAIDQLTIDNQGIIYTGLFGYTYEAHLENIVITNASIASTNRIGILAGRIDYSTIVNSYTTGYVSALGNWTGGLVGINFGSDVVGCFSAADIDAEGYSIGGLCGTLEFGGSIENSYATGDVSGLRNIGGLVGWISTNNEITNSYAAGFISGSIRTGGLVGIGDNIDLNTITHSYWNMETSGQTESFGGEGRTTLEMITENTFVSWDFNDTWDIIEGETYPFLQWQQTPGDFNYPVTTLPPQSFSAAPGNGMITLSWLPPGTGQHTGFKLYRNEILIQTMGTETLVSVDTNVENYVFYTYALTAVYSGDQESNPLTLETFPTPGFSQGEGTEENPYLVSNAGELFTVRMDLSAHYKQTATINLGVAPWNLDKGWIPLSSLGGDQFSGSYNGNGHTISGITINRPDENHQSLFGFVTNGTIANLNIQHSQITGNQRVAVLAGWVNNTHISNINITNSSVTANSLAGGLVYVASSTSTLENIHCNTEVNSMGSIAGGIAGVIQWESTLIQSSSSGIVYAGWDAGGIVGWLAAGAVISQSYSTSNVFVENQNAGGLAGRLTQSHLDNSYATGHVNGNNAGGLIGSIVLYDTHAATVTNNYSVGAVEGELNTGGLVGSITEQQADPLFYFQGVYWDVNSSGQESSALGQGLSTSEMLMQTQFNSFDFSDTWSNIENVTYPYLQWQGEPGLHNYPVIEHQVTFHVDMGNAEGFNPDNDVVYITGCMVEWAEPGADLEHQQMTRLGTTMMWEKNLTLSTGEYFYKYFLNNGWDGGEWADAPDRRITILSDTIIENTWGVPEGGTFIDRIESGSAQLFPNPANDYLYIHTSSAINRIRIVDITGRIVFNKQYNHSAAQIPVDSFEAGLYVVQIYTLEGLMTRKLMVN